MALILLYNIKQIKVINPNTGGIRVVENPFPRIFYAIICLEVFFCFSRDKNI